MTTATWLRRFVTSHPGYRMDSVVTGEIAFDLVVACQDIGLVRGRTSTKREGLHRLFVICAVDRAHGRPIRKIQKSKNIEIDKHACTQVSNEGVQGREWTFAGILGGYEVMTLPVLL